jgi:hypothetical protein
VNDLRFKLSCQCGEVTGVITPTPVGYFTHAVCYCNDCQAFAHALGRAREILDEHGGTRVLQVGSKRMTIDRGHEHIRCMKLSPKGLMRFYAACCNTPIGNVVSGKIPMIGIPAVFVEDLRPDHPVLPVQARVFGRFGHGQLPAGTPGKILPRDVLRAVKQIVGARLRGEQKDSPFFDTRTGSPIVAPEIISKAVRDSVYAAAAKPPAGA